MIKKIYYRGDRKVIKRMYEAVNEIIDVMQGNQQQSPQQNIQSVQSVKKDVNKS